MMKLIVVLAALFTFCNAKPSLVSAPLVAGVPAVVTASSSQYYHRINNVAAAYVAAPAAYVAPVTASYVASPYVSAPYFSASAPVFAL